LTIFAFEKIAHDGAQDFEGRIRNCARDTQKVSKGITGLSLSLKIFKLVKSPHGLTMTHEFREKM
jgi:hypothetical protein